MIMIGWEFYLVLKARVKKDNIKMTLFVATRNKMTLFVAVYIYIYKWA